MEDKTQSSERENIFENMIESIYARTCLSNLIFLPLICPPNFYENMHAFRSPFFQDARCVYTSIEWTPLQTGGESLGINAPIVLETPKQISETVNCKLLIIKFVQKNHTLVCY